MLHEVRELKRQIDPNAPDIHIRQKGRGHDRSGYEGSGSDYSDEERMGQSLQEPARIQALRSAVLSSTYPGATAKRKPYKSFTPQERRQMLQILKE